jgi:hypothetical protein
VNESPYYVWIRNDGYIGVSRYSVCGWVGANGEVVSFRALGKFAVWGDAVAIVEAQRAIAGAS